MTSPAAAPRPAAIYEFRLPALALLSTGAAHFQLGISATGPQYLYAAAGKIATEYGISISRLPEMSTANGAQFPNCYQLDRMIRIAIDTPGAKEARERRDIAQRATEAAFDGDTRAWIRTMDTYHAARKALEALIASALTAAGY